MLQMQVPLTTNESKAAAATSAIVARAALHALGGLRDRGLPAAPCDPERGSATSQTTRWLAQMLDEIDYGMLLLADATRVLHVNRAARADLDAGHPLQLLGAELRARDGSDVARLHDALAGAQRGLRRLVTLGHGGNRISVAVVPLGALALDGPRATLLLLGKRAVCEKLTVQMFAHWHALTPAETRVLEALCEGMEPRKVAQEHGVGLATVRTQIGAIRAKTGAESIRDLLRRIAVLPPVVGVVRPC